MPPNRDDESLPDAGANTPDTEIESESNTLPRPETLSLHWEAPLPPPALLEQYQQLVPGLVESIVEQAQVEASHVRKLEQEAQQAAVRYHARGQWMGLIAVMGIIGLAAFAILMGFAWVAGIATSIIVGTASLFVLGILRKKKE